MERITFPIIIINLLILVHVAFCNILTIDNWEFHFCCDTNGFENIHHNTRAKKHDSHEGKDNALSETSGFRSDVSVLPNDISWFRSTLELDVLT